MPRIISVFGGSAPRPGTPPYEEARALGADLARAGWTVATGGYTGVMEAASRGAAEAGGHVIGVTCGLIENWVEGLRANEWVREEIKFATLRERLYHLVEFCDAAVALPGGIGTLSEISLTWSLLQTGEIKRKPLVLVGRLWSETLSTFIRESNGYLRHGDPHLLRLVNSVDQALQAVNHS
jgi:uncharacterized protein (TIGR00730 family)